jgi:hypothetical protein
VYCHKCMTAGLLDPCETDGHKSLHRIWERRTNSQCSWNHAAAKDLPGGRHLQASENSEKARQGNTGQVVYVISYIHGNIVD